MKSGKFAGHPPELSSAHQEQVPPYTFALVYRDVKIDKGLALHVFGPVDGDREEILRFDCFEVSPHYHLGWSYRDEPFIEISDPDPFAWTIDTLKSSFEDFVILAKGDLDISDDRRCEINEALERLREAAKSIAG